MSQITGFPGGGLRLSKSVVILSGVGNPNTSSTISVGRAGLGSLYLREDQGEIWVCVTAGIFQTPTRAAVPAVWSQLS